MTSSRPSLLCINTGGIGDLHGLRMRRLTAHLDAECTYHDVDKSRPRLDNAREIYALLRDRPWDLVYQEGTGIAGGLNLVWAARTRGQRYILSSGDPIGGYFRTIHGPLPGMAFETYERWLYSSSVGFVGWTPYLTGMALKMGAPQAITVEGAVDLDVFSSFAPNERRTLKAEYGLNPDHIVCGVVGSLKWTPRQQYCYGLELVETLKYLHRPDVSLLIVGDGDGRPRLEARVPPELRDRVIFTGRVAEKDVVRAMNAMDVGFITQTLDELGQYRLTTKMPEYLAAGLPIAMSPTPGFFDYVGEAGWALPAHHPASDTFHSECAAWLDGLTWTDIHVRRAQTARIARSRFSYDVVRPRFTAFINHLLSESTDASPSDARRSTAPIPASPSSTPLS